MLARWLADSTADWRDTKKKRKKKKMDLAGLIMYVPIYSDLNASCC